MEQGKTGQPTPDNRAAAGDAGVGQVDSFRLAEFDRVIQVVNVDRMAVYGHPSIDFARVAAMKAVVAECKDPLVRHVLEMICVKVCRLIQTPDHLDSWQDIAGYARTGVMVTD